MAPRRVTISCPGCRREYVDITVDEAEEILFDGCDECRSLGRDDATVERGPNGSTDGGPDGDRE